MKNDKNKEKEIEFIEDEESPVGVDLAEKLKRTKEKLRVCEKEKQEYLDNWQRERADFLNYKKEEDARKASFVRFTKENFIFEILPVMDSYDMAFSNRESWEKVDKNWRLGVEYIHQQLLKVLNDNGVEEIEAKEGDRFDHTLHQPVESVLTSDESKDHTIAKILQKGYRTKDSVLRPVRVNVFFVG